MKTDFNITGQGVYLLTACTPKGVVWLEKNLDKAYTVQGGSIPCESQAVQDIAAVALSQGYTVALNGQQLTLGA